jgi:phosphoserine aminotransferase
MNQKNKVMRKHIFNAGPCKLSDRTLENTARAVLELEDYGQSIMEVSHRSPEFEAILDETKALMHEVMNIPDDFEILFLGGGASMQFAMIPYNFLKTKAFYLDTGSWSTKAIKEAALWGDVIEVSSEDKGFTYIPKGYKIPNDADYAHITTNNTIKGTEIMEDMDSPVPLMADMSSDFMSRPVDFSKYAMVYGGAQKNVGPAGATFVIIRKSMLDKVVDRPIPTMLKYKTHVDKDSMFNTPPCVNVFAIRETLKWVKEMGGVKAMDKLAQQRADTLYNAIDESKMFKGTVAKEDRSRMNICFVFEDKYNDLQADFLKFAAKRNIVGIKGHRSVGGFRASTYNACTMDDVNALVKAMKDFEKENA